MARCVFYSGDLSRRRSLQHRVEGKSEQPGHGQRHRPGPRRSGRLYQLQPNTPGRHLDLGGRFSLVRVRSAVPTVFGVSASPNRTLIACCAPSAAVGGDHDTGRKSAEVVEHSGDERLEDGPAQMEPAHNCIEGPLPG